MSQNRTTFAQTSTPSSRVSSVTRVDQNTTTGRVTGTLRLRAEDAPQPVEQDTTPTRRIRWSEDVVDNEGLGKKSSKVCCIYHKARPVGESSSESESSDSSDSDSDTGASNGNGRRSCRNHHENHQDSGHGSPGRGQAGSNHIHGNKKAKRRKPSPNAYEKMPKNTKG
ncbi:phosphatase inhibitor-domain-containing protein [Aspergillus heterothallicus]